MMTVRSEKLRAGSLRLTILLFILNLWSASVQAQEFSVAGFRLLPNDVSAFITPVRDLNDEPCALVKVEAPSDFAFSTPLGIVSRKDKVGEIWLYLPKGSKLLTIKHPEWGVLRDYRFSKPLESRMTYELKLKTAQTCSYHPGEARYHRRGEDGNGYDYHPTSTSEDATRPLHARHTIPS